MLSENDWLEIRDEGNNSSPMANKKLCGKSIPKKIVSSGNELMVRFESDGTWNAKGFNITAELGK